MEILHKPSIEIQDAGSSPPTSNEEEAGKESGPTNCPTKDTVDTKPEEGAFAVSDWTHPLLAYLINSDLPTDKNEAQQIVCRSKAYTVINGELYKRSLTSIFQQCVSEEEGRRLLKKFHATAKRSRSSSVQGVPNQIQGLVSSIHHSIHSQRRRAVANLNLSRLRTPKPPCFFGFKSL